MQNNSTKNYNNGTESSQQEMIGETGIPVAVEETRRKVKTQGVQLLVTTVDALYPEQMSAPAIPQVATGVRPAVQFAASRAIEQVPRVASDSEVDGRQEVAESLKVETFPMFGGAAAMQGEMQEQTNVAA
ncbi:MAG TPA: hypothetical protein VLI54_01185 [Bacillota bacterium]|nr:hypothetical protein [Bacillota bacterium]